MKLATGTRQSATTLAWIVKPSSAKIYQRRETWKEFWKSVRALRTSATDTQRMMRHHEGKRKTLLVLIYSANGSWGLLTYSVVL